MNTPAAAGFKTIHSNNSQPHVESPLRKASFPVDPDATAAFQKMRSHESSKRSTENALESETEDDDIYVPPPEVRKSKFTGNGYDPPTEDLGPRGGNSDEKGGYIEERGYGVPILASDEVARTPGAEFMQPAISPAQSRRGSSYYTGADTDYHGLPRSGSRSGSASNSRPTSRPVSVHGLNLSRFSTHEDDRENMHTPLEDVDEYEPLFPDEEGNKKPITAAQRLKQREQMKRFPSQDIWEDTPNSLQLQATVDTPEPVAAQADPPGKAPSAVFETPEQESARKGEVTEEEKAKLIPREERLAKSNFKPHLREEMQRPGMKQRFPSRDIWEDSPDSAELTATVGGDAPSDTRSPPDAGLEAGAVVQTSGSSKDGIMVGAQSRDGATAGVPAIERPSIPPRPNKSKVPPTSTDINQQPPVPARPPRRLHQVPPVDAKVPIAPSKLSETTSPTETTDASPTEGRRGPPLPDRAKPQLPARPTKASAQEGSDGPPLSKITSASSIGSDSSDKGIMLPPGAPKPKPAVPARPAGSKIAALQGGFLADLNSRLKLGPQGPKPQGKDPEPEEETAPLADARKGRAKGPTRRKPVAPAFETAAESKQVAPKWTYCPPVTVWQTDGKGNVIVDSSEPTASIHESPTASIRESPIAKTEVMDTKQVPEALENEMLKAKLAVEESIQASEPLQQEKIATPDTVDLPTPSTEAERNPLSLEANTPIGVETPEGKGETQERSDSQSQTGEKKITVMPGTEEEEKMTAILGGKAQAPDETTGNTLVKE